jgi:hypothetical protein
MDLTLGLGVVGIMSVGAVLLAVGYFGKKMIGGQASKMMLALGLVALLFGGIAYIGIPSGDGNDITPAESAAWDITVTEAENEVFLYANEHRVVVAMSFNDTSDAFVSNTGVITLNFTASRADALLVNAICRGSIGSVPTVDVAGAADEYILDENADGSFNALWTKSNAVTSYESAGMVVEAGDADYATLQITLNAAAVAEMSQYESCDLIVTIGGERWTIEFQKVTVAA